MRNAGVFLENENSRLPEEVSWKGTLSTKKKKKKPKNMTPESSFYWENLLRTEDSLPSALRNCSTDVEEVSMHAIVEKR